MSIPEFGDVIALHAVALIGAKELFDESQVRLFGLVESGEMPWGWLHVYRKFTGTGTANYFLVVKDKDANELNRFNIDKKVVADAIACDLSVIAYVLSKIPMAVLWIAQNLEPQFQTKIETIRLSMASSMPSSNGSQVRV